MGAGDSGGGAGGCRAASDVPCIPAGTTPADELYLCTGCDVFVTVEPCAMCAMALVHSRIRRLIYALPAAEGALGSKYRLHTVPSINHHYQVVRNFLSEEAEGRLERAGAGYRQGAERMAG
jgi:tRNA-specific adenosine deaminase 3